MARGGVVLSRKHNGVRVSQEDLMERDNARKVIEE